MCFCAKIYAASIHCAKNVAEILHLATDRNCGFVCARVPSGCPVHMYDFVLSCCLCDGLTSLSTRPRTSTPSTIISGQGAGEHHRDAPAVNPAQPVVLHRLARRPSTCHHRRVAAASPKLLRLSPPEMSFPNARTLTPASCSSPSPAAGHGLGWAEVVRSAPCAIRLTYVDGWWVGFMDNVRPRSIWRNSPAS